MPTPVAAGPEAAIQAIADTVRALLVAEYEAGTVYEPVGLGIGSPGPINLRTGVLAALPNLPGWERFPLRDRLSEATGLAVTLESDANAAAIAEWKLGAGRAAGLDSMAMLTLGTGVGSGLILAGKIWQGMFGMGGEVGHSSVEPNGWLCACGTCGCLEMYTSANGLVRLAHAVAESPEGTPALRRLLTQSACLTPLAIAQEAEAGDVGSKLAFERLGHYLGIGIANLISTLDVPVIVIGGGVARAWPLFADSMFRTIRDCSMVYRHVAPAQVESLEADRTFICPALLGSAAGLLGAALLPVLGKWNVDQFESAINYGVAR